jgi:hypothetical protein
VRPVRRALAVLGKAFGEFGISFSVVFLKLHFQLVKLTFVHTKRFACSVVEGGNAKVNVHVVFVPVRRCQHHARIAPQLEVLRHQVANRFLRYPNFLLSVKRYDLVKKIDLVGTSLPAEGLVFHKLRNIGVYVGTAEVVGIDFSDIRLAFFQYVADKRAVGRRVAGEDFDDCHA